MKLYMQALHTKLTVLAVFMLILCLPGFASAQEDELVEIEALAFATSDPLESINRPIFAFNERMDSWILRPVAQGYDYVTPVWMRQGVSNALGNLGEVSVTVNSLLQGRFSQAATSGGRFLINSTLGIVGLVDTAEKMGLERARTDFGHTLASWGAPSGPYLVVPFFGPRTVRSGTGQLVDIYMSPLTHVDNVRLKNSVRGLSVVNGRAAFLGVENLMDGDSYLFVRDAYLQQRDQLVNDGVVQDDFSESFDDDWEADGDLSID